MSERKMTIAEMRQIKAVIKALEHGIDACSSDEKSLIRRFVVSQKIKLQNSQELYDEFLYRALAEFESESEKE